MLKNNLPAGVFYVPAYELYDHSDWDFAPDKIAKLKSKKLSIIDYSTENYNHTLPGVYDYFNNLGINFILLSHDPAHHLLNPNLLFHPHYLHWSSENLVFPTLDQSAKKSHKIASLARLPRPHRIVNYMLLRDKHYFDGAVITAHNESSRDAYQSVRSDDITVPPGIQSQWDNIKESLPVATGAQLIAPDVVQPGYIDSYVHLVVETTVNQGFFITEKTWKPIGSGQLFLIWGNAGSIAHLRDMGVDVFDDFIDHKYYDTEQDPLTRLNKIHSVLDDLAAQDLDSIFQQTLARRTSNISKFKNGLFGTQYRDQLTTCINLLN